MITTFKQFYEAATEIAKKHKDQNIEVIVSQYDFSKEAEFKIWSVGLLKDFVTKSPESVLIEYETSWKNKDQSGIVIQEEKQPEIPFAEEPDEFHLQPHVAPSEEQKQSFIDQHEELERRSAAPIVTVDNLSKADDLPL